MPLWFIIISVVFYLLFVLLQDKGHYQQKKTEAFSIFVKYYFQVSFNFTVILMLVNITQTTVTVPLKVVNTIELIVA